MRRVSFGVLSLLALAACGGGSTGAFTGASSGGGGAGTSSAATAGTGGAAMCPSDGDPCTACETAACPKVYCDCYNSPECVAMAECTTKCAPSDVACNQPCWTAHPSAISMGALLVDCAGTSCPVGCPGYQPIGACLVCLYTSCVAEMNACISVPECTNLLACVGACTTPACQTACYQQFPGGGANAGPVATCSQAHCAAACSP